jgi:hypothetical protein
MSKKRSDTSRHTGLPKTDDLKLIKGIGPAIEKRLNGIGIFTFAQLAAFPPADIAAAVSDINGLTSESIIKQDWIGQANKLSAQSTLNNPDWIEEAYQLSANGTVTKKKDVAEIPAETQHTTIARNVQQEDKEAPVNSSRRATFSVELLLGLDNEILSTHIVHRESGDEENWDGWPDAELLNYFAQRAHLKLPQLVSPLSDTKELEPASLFIEDNDNVAFIEEGEIAPPVLEDNSEVVLPMEEGKAAPYTAEETTLSVTMPPHTVNELRMQELKVVARGTAFYRNTLPFEEPFDVQLTIDLNGQAGLTEDTEYTLLIYARGLGKHARYSIGEARGAMTTGESITITIQCNTLPRGTYRLGANGTLLSKDKATMQSLRSVVNVKGDLLLIY